ncbi:hypothetical protein A5659_17720 [Mycobacterium sp. 1165196.3]|uniref:hypothetical protein n=1 Tax=unclassified Mycobacterium TaxID=2642494 RepID=UPI0007FFCEAD|nr:MULTISPECIES: hypothetical protein [unclassified Mycobacterium]OBJ08704.1 hypothetical protein A5624_20335 [Mycobacterium sp. 1482292.6]OBK00464.1 hypothetical protein A9W96_17825 [Mycobacterium sp. 1245852.3]OBK37102.1 hypothetical protein A5659_17720 [Mycobacterium sp. 1165196.3]OBK90847.1 hypothetical protein A5646_04725 [Mycobacterium sp. 1245499.0]
MRYRLDVVATTAVDVVRFAGGWIFDRSMAGWDVTVLLMDLADHPDDRPLQIIGAQVLDLEEALASVHSRPRPQALAAAADLFGCDARVRQGVLRALDQGAMEVTLWGEDWPSELDDSVGLVQHQLSMAAQTFKAQALAAAAVPHAPVGHVETFRSGLLAWPSVAADLVPAS